MPKPTVRYARSGRVNIAYQVLGSGDIDLVYVTPMGSHIGYLLEEPRVRRFCERLASFARLIMFDKRGTGLSDRVRDMPDLETRMDDVRAVMDTVGSQQAAIAGWSEGGHMSILFAATYPQRTRALILWGTAARYSWAPDYELWPRQSAEETEAELEEMERTWPAMDSAEMEVRDPSRDPAYAEWFTNLVQYSLSPRDARELSSMADKWDVRAVLPAIAVPTLVLNRVGDRAMPVVHARYMAEHIRGATLIELDGAAHHPWLEDSESVLGAIEEFLTGARSPAPAERILATVVFLDIVGSTLLAAELGDVAWRARLERFRELVRRELPRFRGRELDTAGDGFLAAVDGPASAIRFAVTVRSAANAIGLELRAGIHTGECEISDGGLVGIALHIGARIAGLAAPGEILASNTVKDLVAGSGIVFIGRGSHELRGLTGHWLVHAVA